MPQGLNMVLIMWDIVINVIRNKRYMDPGAVPGTSTGEKSLNGFFGNYLRG